MRANFPPFLHSIGLMLKKILMNFLTVVVKSLMSIRYRVRIRGMETLSPEALNKPGGILFLPNHPAEIDPVLVVAYLWSRYHMRPIVVEHFFYLTGAHYLMKLIGTLPIPDLEGAVNRWKQKKVEKVFALASEALKGGENFLIYPAGRLKSTGEDVVGAASFVHKLLKECPAANIVLIRTTGLWGSRFSRAFTGKSPNFGKMAWEGIKLVLKNLIFLTPRRDVTIEIQAAPTDFPFSGTRLEMNRYLEHWYNLHGPEPLKLVSDYFWKKSYPQMKVSKEGSVQEEEISIDPEVEKIVIGKIAELTRRPPEQISKEQDLARDLGLDSLDVAQLYAFLEERYEVEGVTLDEFNTVTDVLKAATRQKEHIIKEEERLQSISWPQENSRPPISSPQGKTIGEAFLNICHKMDGHPACADALYGVMTYRRLKLMALILAKSIRKFEGKYVGILLPSSSTTYVLVFACLLAKKVPVMLNWTVGVRTLDHCVRLTDLKVVLSSRRFLNNLNNGDLGSVDEKLVLMEDLKEEISLWQKMGAVYQLLKDTKSLLKALDLEDVQETDSAVVLFTSGTESLPKGVPLSHKNLLQNQKAALKCLHLKNRDIMYGVLPPFHSFGFSATGILPILAGMRAYFAPDPTDSHAMARDIFAWKITLFCCAPSFIRGLLRVATSKQLESLSYIVGGAEKVPQELFDQVRKLGENIEFLEGYGITECSPVVTLTYPGKPRTGVGQPLGNVELCVIHDETGAVLPTGQEGEICIKGPNVFEGYLGSQKSPFIEINGKKWYRSGDRGYLTDDGSLVLSGRIKRFVKIGGEMVSLGGLEEELLNLAAQQKWANPEVEGPPLALGVAERESDKPLITLFTTFDISKETINSALRERGYGRIVKIAEVKKLDQIPTTGTGKTHYRALDDML